MSEAIVVGLSGDIQKSEVIPYAAGVIDELAYRD
jgi:hypothetical protein